MHVWKILEHKRLEKEIAGAPPQVQENYEFWKNVVRHSGPEGLRELKGFHDEALTGRLRGLRSSRLNKAWRVLYKIDRDQVTVIAERFPSMTTARDYVPEKRHVKLTPGRALQIARELQELTQSELARRTGIAQSAISALESGAVEMGLQRARVLAEALGVHPAVLAFPDYQSRESGRRRKAGVSQSERPPAKRRVG